MNVYWPSRKGWLTQDFCQAFRDSNDDPWGALKAVVTSSAAVN